MSANLASSKDYLVWQLRSLADQIEAKGIDEESVKIKFKIETTESTKPSDKFKSFVSGKGRLLIASWRFLC